jgi:hypothetical protein
MKEKIKAAVKKVDWFQFEPNPRMTIGPSTSVRGFFGTLVLVMVIIAYAVYSLIKWLTVPAPVSLTQTSTLEEEMPMTSMCVTLPNITDTSYWSYSFQRQGKDPVTGDTISRVDIPLTPVGTGKDAKLCLGDDQGSIAYLRSFCNPGDCDSLKFKLFACGTPGTPSANASNNISCAALDVLGSILERNYVTFQLFTEAGTILVQTPPKIVWSVKYFVFFQLHERVVHPDLLHEFTTKSRYRLEYEQSTYSLQYFFGPGMTPAHEVIECEFRLGPLVFHSIQSGQTSLDLVGSWGAFFGVVSGILAIYFRRHNRNEFYRHYPTWARVNAMFQVEPHRASESSPMLGSATSTDSYCGQIFSSPMLEKEEYQPIPSPGSGSSTEGRKHSSSKGSNPSKQPAPTPSSTPAGGRSSHSPA